MSDKERIAELTAAFNRVCAENYDLEDAATLCKSTIKKHFEVEK